jgi:hypothetical protein
MGLTFDFAWNEFFTILSAGSFFTRAVVRLETYIVAIFARGPIFTRIIVVTNLIGEGAGSDVACGVPGYAYVRLKAGLVD